MKYKIFYLILITNIVITGVIAQNSSVGIYSIYETNDEYYLLAGTDSLWLDKYGITVKFQDYVTEAGKEAFSQDYNLIYVRETVGSYVNFKISNTSNYISVCDSIYNDTRVKEFLFDFRLTLYNFTPDDEYVAYQWYLDQIDVFEAWDITLGSEDVTVAVIDEGLFLAHDELGYNGDPIENVFHNQGEDAWTYWYNPGSGNDLDDDGNNKIDDWKGWNYCNYVFDPPIPAGIIEDNNVIPEQVWGYHGTAVSGVISAKTNNNLDIAGIAGGNYAENIGGAKILPIKIFDWKENPSIPGQWEIIASSSSIPAAIMYAVEMEANIINMSFGLGDVGNVHPPLLSNIETALEYACNDDNNILITGAAGNQGWNNTISYPASSDYVIAVGATDKDDEDLDWSNKGDELELAAPGIDIYTLDNNWITSTEGTSFSSPMVAATAALMLSVKPDLTNIEMREILKNTAEKVGIHSYNQNGWNKYLGYGRINTYYAVCEVLKLLPPITVNTSGVWDEPVFSLHDIVVETGNTLTITSTVSMGTDAKIIVEQGATLILDGGTLTNYKFCGHENNLWAGVEVWGTSNETQYLCQGELHQGKIIIQNGGTIENAEIGVLLGARDLNTEGDFDDDKAGGIIQAPYGGDPQVQDAYFKNNKWAIRFWKYQNFTVDPVTCENLRPAENLSFLQNCTFNINTDYLGGQWWFSHVHLFDVNGIDFYGCTFVNNQTADPEGHGINAYGAGFRVEAICNSQQAPCPEEDLDKCTFTYFKKAINNQSSGTRTIYVSDADFLNNSYGIQLNNVNNATVLFSNFDIAENPAEEEKCEGEGKQSAGYGIDLTSCTGFAIEENYFTKAQGAPSGIYIGIRIKDSETEYDIIYRNIFDGLSYGNFAEGNNRSSSWDLVGLEFQCNSNTGNNIDFIVTGGPYPQIRTFQGTQDVEAGNIFSPNAQWHFKNDGTQVIDYFYLNNPPVYYTPYYVVPIVSNGENTCPSHYGGGGGGTDRGLVLTPEQKQESEQDYATNLADYNNVKALFDNLKDGGNTDALQNEVELSWPQDMWELRAELLGKSPHLSKEVLMTVADKTDVLPESILFEILSANPDELRKDELISYLENKEQPLPEYMISILKQLAGGITYKTILLQEMARYNAAKTKAAYDLIRSSLNDSVTDYQYLRNWLDNLNNMNTDIQIISTYMEESDFVSAQSLLDMIP
ncbi:MAG: S8 family serine peptidase, partial [Bacteroidales bacterium]|nr:S8 family serine peptidase [Bacteroidales bacterium]